MEGEINQAQEPLASQAITPPIREPISLSINIISWLMLIGGILGLFLSFLIVASFAALSSQTYGFWINFFLILVPNFLPAFAIFLSLRLRRLKRWILIALFIVIVENLSFFLITYLIGYVMPLVFK